MDNSIKAVQQTFFQTPAGDPIMKKGAERQFVLIFL